MLKELVPGGRPDLQPKSNSKQLIVPDLHQTKTRWTGEDEERSAALQPKGLLQTINWWITGFIFLNKLIKKKKKLRWGIVFDEQISWGFFVIISPRRNERLRSQLEERKGGTLPPHYYTLSYCHRVPTHNTKPEALLFIVRIGRLSLSWMGWIRYVLLLGEGRSTQELGPPLLYDAHQQT